METKICARCRKEKEIEQFSLKKHRNKYRRFSYCHDCELEYKKEYRNTIEGKNKIKEYKRKYKKKNNTKISKEKAREYRRRYREKNREKVLERKKKDYQKSKENKVSNLKNKARSIIYRSFKRKNYNKKQHTEEIIGCKIETFIVHLLKTYKNNYGVEWDNKEKVHIDHIIPLSTAKTEEDVIKLCHYTNLQLLKARDNIYKSNKLNWKIDN